MGAISSNRTLIVAVTVLAVAAAVVAIALHEPLVVVSIGVLLVAFAAATRAGA